MEKFHYQGKEYDLIAYDSHHLMMYGNFGVEDVVIKSHGQVQTTVFGINEKNVLMVKEHRVSGKTEQAIGKIYPEHIGDSWGVSVYKNLNKIILYTGYIFIGNSTTSYAKYGKEWFSNAMKEEPAQCYELYVVDGKVLNIVDYSEFVVERARQNPKIPANLTSLQRGEKYSHRLKTEIDWQFTFMPRKYKYIFSMFGHFYYDHASKLKKLEGK